MMNVGGWPTVATSLMNAAGLPAEVRQLFDPGGDRKYYLVLQEILTGLRFRERAELGRAFHEVCEGTRGQAQCLSFKAVPRDDLTYDVGAVCSAADPTISPKPDYFTRTFRIWPS